MNKIDKFSTEKNAQRRDAACRVPAKNALKGQNNSAWGNALRIMTDNALRGTDCKSAPAMSNALRNDGDSGLLRTSATLSPRNDGTGKINRVIVIK